MNGVPESLRSSTPRLDLVPWVCFLLECMRFSYTLACCWSPAAEPLDLRSTPRTEHCNSQPKTFEIRRVNSSFRSGWGVSGMYSLGLSFGKMMIFSSVILDLLPIDCIKQLLPQAADTRRLSEGTRTGTEPALLLKIPGSCGYYYKWNIERSIFWSAGN